MASLSAGITHFPLIVGTSVACYETESPEERNTVEDWGEPFTGSFSPFFYYGHKHRCNAIKWEHTTGLLEPLSTKPCFSGKKCIIFGLQRFYLPSVHRYVHLRCGWTSGQKHLAGPKERFQDLVQASSCSPRWGFPEQRRAVCLVHIRHRWGNDSSKIFF